MNGVRMWCRIMYVFAILATVSGHLSMDEILCY